MKGNGARLPLIGMVMVSLAGLGTVFAQVPVPFVGGDSNAMQIGFFECKTSASVIERTFLMIDNIPVQRLCGYVLLVDGNENPLAVGVTPLSENDLDEIDICATLTAAGYTPPPQAGVIELVTTLAPPPPVPCPPAPSPFPFMPGAYAWTKNFVFTPAGPILRVTGVGVTELRHIPDAVFGLAPFQSNLLAKINFCVGIGKNNVPLVFAENTNP